MKLVKWTSLLLALAVGCSGFARAQSEQTGEIGTQYNPFPFNSSELKEIAMLFEVVGPVNGSTTYKIESLESAGVSPFAERRYLREIQAYVRNNSGPLARVLENNNGIYVRVTGVPLAAVSYDFDDRAYNFAFPDMGYIVGWPGTEDGKYYIIASDDTALLSIQAVDYYNPDSIGRGNRDGLPRDAFSSHYFNGHIGAQSGGRFPSSIAVPMSEEIAEELFQAIDSSGREDPLIMSATIVCKLTGPYCPIQRFRAAFSTDNLDHVYELSWQRHGVFQIETITSN